MLPDHDHSYLALELIISFFQELCCYINTVQEQERLNQ